MTPSPSEERIGAEKGLHFVCVLLVQGQSIILRTWWTLCFCFLNWSF